MTPKNNDLYFRVYNKACDYLSVREHSKLELRNKLKRKIEEADNETLDHVLNELEHLGLQSDERFAESFARSRFGKGYGPLRIHRELGTKGIDSFDLSQFDFRERAYDFANSYIAKNGGASQDFEARMKLKKKLYDNLVRRGFDFGTVKEVVDDLI